MGGDSSTLENSTRFEYEQKLSYYKERKAQENMNYAQYGQYNQYGHNIYQIPSPLIENYKPVIEFHSL